MKILVWSVVKQRGSDRRNRKGTVSPSEFIYDSGFLESQMSHCKDSIWILKRQTVNELNGRKQSAILSLYCMSSFDWFPYSEMNLPFRKFYLENLTFKGNWSLNTIKCSYGSESTHMIVCPETTECSQKNHHQNLHFEGFLLSPKYKFLIKTTSSFTSYADKYHEGGKGI